MMKVSFVGDIGIFKKYEDFNIDPFSEIDLPNSDFNIGNFEFVIPKIKSKFFYDVQEKYSCSYAYLKKLNTQRFHGLGMANNHSLDYGKRGIQDTIEYLQNIKIKVFGFSNQEEFTLGEFEKNGIKLAILACVKPGRWSKEKYGYGPDSYQSDNICKYITKIKKSYDHIVIFPHWGTELIEIPNFEDTKNAKKFIDSGASAVIGHHPHILQGIESYNNGLIAYSLGSFIYVHEEELGYSKGSNRNLSMCLNIEFTKNKILKYRSICYKYNENKLIPEIVTGNEIDSYLTFLNDNIYNQHLFRSQIRKILLKRELSSFFQRFSSNPFKTTFNYLRLFKFKYLLKIFR